MNRESPLRAGWAAALVAAVVLVYAGTIDAPFLFDDAGAVVNNPTIRRLGWGALNPPADGSTTTGRPLVNLSFALNHAFGGERVIGYHAVNLALHLAATLTLFGIVRRTLQRRAPRAQNSTDVQAFAIALIWGVHPLQTESVISIAQRTELLCGWLYLATLYAFIRATDDGGGSEASHSSTGWLLVSVAACLLGMAAKEVMVTAPVLVLLYDRGFIAASWREALRRRRTYYAALAATWLLLVALIVRGGAARGVSAGFGFGVSSWEYLLTQCAAIVTYLQLALWPFPLVFDYGTTVVHTAMDVGWQALIVAALLAFAVWALVRHPRAGFLGAAFFLLLAPSSSVVPLVTQTIAEHRMYLPLAVIVAAGVLGLAAIARARTFAVCAATAVCLGLITTMRGRDYRSAVALWADTVAKRPGNVRAHHNLALALQEAGRAEAANAAFARTVALDPGYVPARYNWALSLLAQQRTTEAIAQFRTAVDLAERAAPRGTPSAAGAELVDAHYQLGRLAERSGDLATAETEYGRVLQRAPNHIEAHARLGVLLARSGRTDPGVEHLRAAARLAPDNTEVRANLGNVLLLQGRVREAIECYEQVLRVHPDDGRVRENLQLARAAAH